MEICKVWPQPITLLGGMFDGWRYVFLYAGILAIMGKRLTTSPVPYSLEQWCCTRFNNIGSSFVPTNLWRGNIILSLFRNCGILVRGDILDYKRALSFQRSVQALKQYIREAQ